MNRWFKMLNRFAPSLAVLVITLVMATPTAAQNTREDLHTGPVIEEFGQHVDLPDAGFVTRTDSVYKVAMEIHQPLTAPERPHPRLDVAARLVNMLAHAGTPRENVQVAVVLHGGGTRAALTNEGYRERYDMDNPNIPLLEALVEAGVEVYLCEQSRTRSGVQADEVAAPVKSALSAITTATALQADGYSFLTY